jgi:EamA domain-containing membrane protein RarD
MNSIILTGVITVQFALLSYTVFIINEHKKRRAANSVIYSLTIAVIFDLIATGSMMAGTEKTYFTLHGLIGYSALALMVVDAVLIWRHKIKNGVEVTFSKGLNIYSKVAYAWWLVAFLNGVSNVV